MGPWGSVDARLTPPGPRTSTLAHPDRRGLPATLQLAGALEQALGRRAVLRLGAYLEPGRDRAVRARVHLTGGFDLTLEEPVLELLTGVTATADRAPPDATGPAYLQLVLAPLVTLPDELWPGPR